MAKENNQFGYDCAFPGLCSLCHCEVAEFDGSVEIMPGVYRPRITKLKGNYRIKNLELSDGTIMTIALCAMCENLKPGDCGKIMESEVRGWHKECNEIMSDVKQDIKDAYLLRQSTLTITDIPAMKWTPDEKKSIATPDIQAMRLPKNVLNKETKIVNDK